MYCTSKLHSLDWCTTQVNCTVCADKQQDKFHEEVNLGLHAKGRTPFLALRKKDYLAILTVYFFMFLGKA